MCDRFRISVALCALLALASCGGENAAERLAGSITAAIVANDMRPVEKHFNALVRPKLEDRGRVGRLSDELNALGKLKRVKETTASGESSGRHTFIAEFTKGSEIEEMTLDGEGKISAFHVRGQSAPAEASSP
jgi:hypothetical protein